MEFEDGERPIIVRKVKKVSHGGHHGGAWKVAFADFAVAMMAFFMVLWLMEAATVKEKQAISGYFNDPSGFTEGGSPYVIDLEGSLNDTDSSDVGGKEETVSKEELEARRIVVDENTVQDLVKQIEMKKFKELQSTLQAKIAENPELEKYKDQIIMEITDDGLQIQIVDKDSRPMFDSGSNKIKNYTTIILEELASTIGTLENKISVSGHTDAAAFTERKDYSNWELSSERANSARRSLVRGGIAEEKIAQVVGLSSSVLFDQEDPLNPTNRRISILVLNESSAQRIARQQQGSTDQQSKPSQQTSKENNEENLPDDPEFDNEMHDSEDDYEEGYYEEGYSENDAAEDDAESSLKENAERNTEANSESNRILLIKPITKTLDQRKREAATKANKASAETRKADSSDDESEFF